ncbi:MAG: capsular biosynthesis protein, partial [Paracoccaceae bacterium]
RLRLIPWSWRGFPETSARVAVCLARAKRQPVGVGRWFKAVLIRLQYNGARRLFMRSPGVVTVAWNGLGGSRLAFLLAARDAGLATLACELAPFPGRITLDPRGVNAESVVPREPGFFRDWAGDDALRTGEGWRELGQGLTARASRRADVGQSEAALPEGAFLFCPLQVPSDSQVTLFAGWTGGMAGFLAALGQAAMHLPDGWHLRVKEHPSARESLADALAGLVALGRVVVDNSSDSFAQLAASRGVVTLNSSIGLQAFFHDKPVVVLGEAFFKQAGLVVSVGDQAGLNAAFVGAAGLAFDPAGRARFMNWLDQVYYPRIDPPDFAALKAKLAEARTIRG